MDGPAQFGETSNDFKTYQSGGEPVTIAYVKICDSVNRLT